MIELDMTQIILFGLFGLAFAGVFILTHIEHKPTDKSKSDDP